MHLEQSRPRRSTANDGVERIEFADGDVDRRRHDHRLGRHPARATTWPRQSGLAVGERGGIIVNDRLETSDPHIFAIGECALHGGMIYGLVAPGYEMAEIVAANLTGGDRRFRGTDLSTKLKLMGVDVASFGTYEAAARESDAAGVRRSVRRRLQEAALHARRHAAAGRHPGRRRQPTTASCSMLAKSDAPLPCQPHELMVAPASSSGAAIGLDAMPDSAQVCSCNNVSKGAICAAVRDRRRHARRAQALHQSRHRLRRLRAAGDRPAQSRVEKGRPGGRQSSVRALSATRGPNCSRS